MKIYGLAKLTLLDFPGKMACTVFTGGCNMRCPFCHNAPLVTHLNPDEALDTEEFFTFLQKRSKVLEGVAITGGEPLIHNDISAFIERIRALGYLVKLDTNGSFPDKLEELINNKLIDYVAMDIKNSPELYPKTVGLADFDVEPVKRSVSLLLKGTIPFEFRTTVVKELHTPQDIVSIAKWIQGAPKYFLQQFKDSGALIGSGFSAYSPEEMARILEAVKPFIPGAELRGI